MAIELSYNQKRLEANGFGVGENGEYTELAVRKFQAKKGLPVTGVVDSAVETALSQSDPDPQE